MYLSCDHLKTLIANAVEPAAFDPFNFIIQEYEYTKKYI